MKTPEGEKLNLFALPNQTTILVGIIAFVILGAIVAGSIGRSPIPVWIFAIGITFLPLRSFLAWPEREILQKNLRAPGTDLMELQNLINDLAAQMELPHLPLLLVRQESLALHTFGSFRRWYITVDQESALDIQVALDNPKAALTAQAGIIHELAHFKNGDYWQIGFIRELLRITVSFLLWAIAFFLGYGFLLILAAPMLIQSTPDELVARIPGLTPDLQNMIKTFLPSTQEWAQVSEKAASINMTLVLTFIFSALWPFVLVGGVIWGLYWPKLLRTREYYADAIAAHQQKDSLLMAARIWSPFQAFEIVDWDQFHTALYIYIGAKFQVKKDKWTSLKEKIGSLRRAHPHKRDRIAGLFFPGQIFDDWRTTAILLGSFTLILDILLSSPLTLLYIGALPMHFVTLSMFILLGLNLIALIVRGGKYRKDIAKITTFICALRLVWLLFTFGVLLLFLQMGSLNDLLSIAVANTAHFAGYSDQLGYSDPQAFLIQAAILNFAQILVVYIFLLVALNILISLLQRVLSWYGYFQTDRQFLRVAYRIIIVSTIFLASFPLLMITKALLEPESFFTPMNIFAVISSSVLAVIGGIWFYQKDGQYAKRCPKCAKVVPNIYRLGDVCDCGEALNPWLFVEYR